MATKAGYLAALWKSIPQLVGASELHSLLLNGDFEAGLLTSWAEDHGGASSATVTALKGYLEKSYGVAFVDDGAGAKIHQTRTLDAAIGATTYVGTGNNDLTPSGTYTGVVALSIKVEIDGGDPADPNTFKWSSDGGVTWTAETVDVTGAGQLLIAGVSITFGAITGHDTGDYWTFTVERLRGLAYVWAKLPTTKTASLKISFLNAADGELATATDTILAHNPAYGDALWGYWSIYKDVPLMTKKVKVEIYSAVAMTWYADQAGALIGEQVVGAFAMSLRESKDALETTTFKSAQDNSGARSYVLGLSRTEFNADTIWQGVETYDEIQDAQVVFAQVFFEEGTAKEREEFWAVMTEKSFTTEEGAAQKKAIVLVATGDVGETAG